jgi:hypothetical protein
MGLSIFFDTDLPVRLKKDGNHGQNLNIDVRGILWALESCVVSHLAIKPLLPYQLGMHTNNVRYVRALFRKNMRTECDRRWRATPLLSAAGRADRDWSAR